MSKGLIEGLIGLVVLVVIAVPVVNAVDDYVNAVPDDKFYRIHTDFNKIGGVKRGMEVRLGGIQIGSIGSMELDQLDVIAKVTLYIDRKYKLPIDTEVSVKSAGVLGGSYINLQPGTSEERVEPGGRLENVINVSSLEDEIAQVAFGSD